MEKEDVDKEKVVDIQNKHLTKNEVQEADKVSHQEEMKRDQERHDRYERDRKERRKRMYLQFTFFIAFMILALAASVNIDVFRLDKETVITINQAVNAVILLIIPFLLGSVGGFTRVLMADVSVDNKGTLVVSSGLMAMFSWIGIKSGVLLAIVAPHLEKQGVQLTVESQTTSGFYTMALVAIMVGMFSTNLYLFINGKVEQLTAKSKLAENKP